MQKLRHYNAPHPELGSLLSLPEIQARYQDVRLTSWDQAKETKANMSKLGSAWTAVCDHVRKQVSRVIGLLEKEDRAIERAEDARQRDIANIVCEIVKGKKRKDHNADAEAMAAKAFVRSCRILQDIRSEFKKVDTIEFSKFKLEGDQCTTPAVVKTDWGFNRPAEQIFEHFHQRFTSSPLYATSGRGAEILVGDSVDKFPKHSLRPVAEKVASNLTHTDVRYMERPWLWGLSKTGSSAGPEYAACPSFKYHWKGQRTCMLVNFETLKAFASGTARPGSVMTPQRMIDLWSEADASIIDAIVAAEREVLHAVVTPGHALYVPAGYILFEKADNQEGCVGLR